eukprot:TRINITY_DN38010_c0_g1_i1.p1 TRINITY_DN38010_c0_g1~~TRINITY_DN38010_c0_g1_i1.p1  ORF type:complete len:343 (+),score=82.21 TRINITY_DN38010_c0_g1_i1:116-1030(+)
MSLQFHTNFTDAETDTMQIVTGVASGVSLIGSLFIASCYMRFGGSNMELLLWLSISDVLSDASTIAALFVSPDNEQGCKTVGFLVTALDLPPVLWTGCLSLSLFITVFLSEKTGKKGVQYLYFYFFISFGIPLATAVIALLKEDFGDSGYGFCWIEDPTERLLYFFFPLWVVIFFNSIVYFVVTREYKKVLLATQGSLSANSSSRAHRLKYYPLVLVVTWSFGTAHRLAQALGIHSYPLAILHMSFSRLQGFFNAFVYSSDIGIKQALPCLGSRSGTSYDGLDTYINATHEEERGNSVSYSLAE